MKCSDLQSDLALFAAGSIDASDSRGLKAHLEACPVCRQRFDEIREIAAGLRQLRPSEISGDLTNAIKRRVRNEIHSPQKAAPLFSAEVGEWLMMSVMPFSVGVCASLLIGLTFLTMMFSGMLKPGNVPASYERGGSSILLASNRDPFDESSGADISPSDYAQTRLGIGSESPSINPQGSLVELTRLLNRGQSKGDEVVVVADVFKNGQAQIAEVVEPSRNRHAVNELEKALDTEPSYAAFVPASFENRPDNVRVILKFQSVNVNASPKHRAKHN